MPQIILDYKEMSNCAELVSLLLSIRLW